MMDWIGLAIFIFYLAFASLVIVQYFKIRNHNKSLVVNVAQLMLDRDELIKKLEQSLALNNSVEKTDGFLKFVSESRDWAFEYIEGIQKALVEYDEALSSNDANKLNETYKTLIGFLPGETTKS